MTIFQKMIFVPVLSLLIYSGFIIFSFSEQQRSTRNIEQLRDDYMPVLVLVKDNLRLFEELRDVFKDAVLAGERRWIADTLVIKQEIEGSFALLANYPQIIDQANLKQTQQDFRSYYKDANRLADSIFKNKEQWDADDQLVKNVEHYLIATTQHFLTMEQRVQSQFRQTIDRTNHVLQQLLFWGGIISGCSMLFLLFVTLMVSLSTRRNIFQLVSRTKALAQGEVNFSRRLERESKDELGELIYWFNQLSNKLEVDYRHLQDISITDKLTQLNNRTRTDQYLPVVLNTSLQENNPLHLVLADIDHFKLVNDNHGHLAGDRVLQCFAEILKANVSTRDFIGRWGGEEFILVWPNISPEEAKEKAERLRTEVESRLFPDVGKLTASFGVTQSQGGDTPESIVDRADGNLYRAKENGRNQVVQR